MIVDCAAYADGQRCNQGQMEIDHALERAADDDAFVWIGLYEPTEDEFDAVKREFHLHELAVEDAIHAHQRPKLELYGDTIFVVLKTARYVDSDEVIELGEILIFIGEGFIVTVRHGEATGLHDLREQVESDQEMLKHGPAGVLHAIVDKVVDDYGPALEGLDEDISEVEDEVFSEAWTNRAERIYKLKREVLQFLKAATPLTRADAAPGPPRAPAGARGGARLLPRRDRPPGARAGPARGLPRPADQRPGGQPVTGRRAPERGHAQDLGLGGHRRGAHHDRRHLRHELRAHARAGLDATATPRSWP